MLILAGSDSTPCSLYTSLKQLVDGIAEQLDENNLGFINSWADHMVERVEANGLPLLKETVQQSYQQVNSAIYFSLGPGSALNFFSPLTNRK